MLTSKRHITKNYIILTLALAIGVNSFAGKGDEERGDLNWLLDFVSSGLKKAEATYIIDSYMIDSGSEDFLNEEKYEITFDFTSNVYSFKYTMVYRESWSILTKGGISEPPKMDVKFVGSKTNYWTNYKGVGEYSEIYERKVPNWLNFAQMDTVLMMMTKLDNPLPAISGMFYDDELKLLKKIYKLAKKGKSITSMWNNFEYDNKGNVVNFSKSFFTQELNDTSTLNNGVKSSDIKVFNNSEKMLKIHPLKSKDNISILEGIMLVKDNQAANLFNLKLNTMFHKFAPEIFSDPDETMINYLKELSAVSGEDLMRFENN